MHGRHGVPDNLPPPPGGSYGRPTPTPVDLDKPGVVRQRCWMKKRPTAKSSPKKGKDPYLLALGKIWPSILLAYDDFKDLKPILEYRLREKILYAYPALPYINDLTDRTREQARRTYMDAIAGGEIMVFICDTGKRVLRSYVFPVEEPEKGRSKSTVL
jgi:hypothetical protein